MRHLLLLSVALCLLGCGDEKKAGREYRDAAQRMIASRDFLEDVASQDGVNRTRSGLLYRVAKNGEGTTVPQGRDAVLIHYRASLTDGNEIDSSYERNAPARFDMETLLAGLREGIALMRKGDRFRFFIPPQMAYGARGKPPIIPPNAAMIYEVELLDIFPQAQ